MDTTIRVAACLSVSGEWFKYIICLKLWMGISPPPQIQRIMNVSSSKRVKQCCNVARTLKKTRIRITIEFCGATTLHWVVLRTKIDFGSLGHLWSYHHEIRETCYSTLFSLSKNSFSFSVLTFNYKIWVHSYFLAYQ